MLETLVMIALGLALFQGLMVARNLTLFTPPDEVSEEAPPLSVLVPARDEAANLPGLLESLRQQTDVPFEVVIVDDGSEDDTWAIASQAAAMDPRVRVFQAPPLPPGWAGKQHACWQLAQQARYAQWLYLDADVRLTDPRALARISSHLARGEAAMQSGLPWQKTEGLAEQLVIPLIHLVLLGYLPFWEMRRNRLPALGAACGQMVAVKAEAYRAVGGHEAVRHRLHDATALAALFRKAGWSTDLFDATPLASCRMYQRATDVWEGFAKNATEGMAQPKLLPLWTALLLGANLLPWWLAAAGLTGGWLAVAVNLGVYAALMQRFRQAWLGTVLRPLGVAALVAIQWWALAGKWVGWKATWKGRHYLRAHG